MKNIIENTLFCLIALLVVFPWIIGIVDMAWYILAGNQLSGIDWRSGRGALAALWPILWLLTLGMFSGL